MAADTQERRSKQHRREERRRAARRRVLATRARRAGVVAAVLAIPGLWAWERAGSQEIVEAEVVETRRWQHSGNDGTSHPHIAATLQIEGLSETTLQRADGYERGRRVPVWIRRGRISRWPYFLDVAKPGEIEGQRREGEGPQAEAESTKAEAGP
jgi:hypothetical protein